MILALVLVALLAPAAGAEGIRWSDATYDEALALAQKKNTLILIDLYSDHCMQCKDVEEEIWQAAEGAELGEDLIALQISMDSPAGVQFSRRVPVLGLPAVVFLLPGGEEVGRVQGYRGKMKFMIEARDLKSGIDPLPAMESDLAAHPESMAIMVDGMEQSLFRKRQAEAQKLLDRVLALDAAHESSSATKGLTLMAKYHEYFRGDTKTSLSLWKSLVELYPTSPGVTSGINGSCKIAVTWGQTAEWIDWICKIGAQHPEDGRLHYNIAIIPYHQGLRHPCLAASARKAKAKGVGPANMDEIAAELEGASTGK
ncbi:MAG: thioredoxin family protein [Candidatus Eisenbacteria bacterium]